ncbi:MAG: cysteine--tRNA ligase [Patescibacteria group bacterium]
MALSIYNTLSRSKEIFEPLNNKSVGLYTCGPTVYNYPHIGNYRAYVFGDILKRYLKYREYKVKHIMNITDIDDKTIRDSIIEEKTLKEFTEFYTEEFYKDRDALNIIPADKYTKATDYVKEMLELTEKLVENSHAYMTDDGSAYFSIKKDTEYGKLSHFTLSDLKENAEGRMKSDEYDKDNAQDFALWKAWDKNDGDVFWNPSEMLDKDTKLTKGRPGWHIECSAMSMKELGESFDLHTGGVDNIFPHHENEIAQSECATGHMFVKYWMHNEHLMVDGKKMAKSAGNFYTLRDLIEKDINPLAFRLWLYTAHYRTKTNFTIDAVLASQTALGRLYDSFRALGEDTGKIDQKYKEKLIAYMDDDLDTPKALALLWDLVRDGDISNPDKRATMLDFDQVFGFGIDKLKEDVISEGVMRLANEREKARQAKDWAKSDELRDKIKDLGYEVKDLDEGYKISKILKDFIFF